MTAGLAPPPLKPPPPPAPPGSSPDGRTRRRRHRKLRAAALILVVLMIPTGWSYGHALSAPGSQGWQVATVEWFRDHGFNGMVNHFELEWLKSHSPPRGGQPAAVPVSTGTAAALPRMQTPALRPLAGEGIWRAAQPSANGVSGLSTTFVRPDAIHTRYVVGLARLDPKLVRLHLVAGTRQPGGGGWPWGGKVPANEQTSLVAAFNSGFKMRDAQGGFFAEGRTAKPLVNDGASLVIRNDGTADVLRWGRDITSTNGVTAVRQNLRLIADEGSLAPGLAANANQQWGNQASGVYTWRSAIGVDRHGYLIYAGGDGMDLVSLANTMRRAGAVRAMELDIHNRMVTFNLFQHATGGLRAAKLTPSMPDSAFRYLSTDQRDFVAVFGR